MDLKVLKRIMPGLRRLALFAAKSVAIASTETCIELEDLEQWVKQHGRPTPADIEDLEDQLAGVDTNPVVLQEDLGETVRVLPPLKPAIFSKPAPVAAAIAAKPQPVLRPAPALQPITAPKAAEVPNATPSPMKAKTKNTRSSDPERWRKVARMLLEDQDATELDIVKKAGIPVGSWGGFKKRTFGTGKIPTEKLRKFIAGGSPAAAEGKPNKLRKHSAPNLAMGPIRSAPPPVGSNRGREPAARLCVVRRIHGPRALQGIPDRGLPSVPCRARGGRPRAHARLGRVRNTEGVRSLSP